MGRGRLDRRGAAGRRLFQDGQRLVGAAGIAQHQRQQQAPHRFGAEAGQALARQPLGVGVAGEIAIGAGRGQKGVVGGIGFCRLLEHRDRLGGLAVLLQQGGEVHRHEPVLAAGGKQRAQLRQRPGHLPGPGQPHGGFTLFCNGPVGDSLGGGGTGQVEQGGQQHRDAKA